MLYAAVFVLLLLMGVPIAFVLGISSLVFAIAEKIDLIAVPQRMFVGINKNVLMCIPFFILAGNIMNTGGITRRLVGFSMTLVGWVRGGLAMVCVITSMIFAGITGSAQADAAALGSVLIPAMEKEKYDLDFAASVVTAAAVIGPIIPPSIMFVVFGVVGEVSIGALFTGGYVPGILIGVGLMVLSYVYARKRNYPRGEKQPFRHIFKTFINAFPALMMPVIIVGGILSGIFTPTEAAAVSVLYSLIVGFFVYRELKPRHLPKMILEAAELTTAVMLIMATATIFGWLLTYAQIPQKVTAALLSVSDSPWVFLLLVNLLLLFVGTWMDPTAAIIVLVPILLPAAIKLGINPIHFGLVVSINLIIGLATPPVGYILYITSAIGKISLERLSRAVWPFLLVEIAVLLLLTYLPWVGLAIPTYFGYTR
jgi:tripartite ATP-independent transporter DctM subunit